ncbi:MAG TPA: AmpG family muropeptide MFS transporter [Gammaproteobacteria bacterium]|nr:AmpG family muropeptide MFS transporter [Gammaproteobacteria bacterium]
MSSERVTGSWRVLLAPRLWIAGAMGFASGLPLLLTLTVLQAWLTDSGVSLTAIGFAGLVGLPYTVKFLWAPLLDRFKPLGLGRRRSWLLIFQLCLAASIAFLGVQDPRESLWLVAVAALLVAFCSASQDVVVDAYRRETLADSEQGLGASMYTYGYRTGMLLASAGGLILADVVGFRGVYLFMAAVMLSMVIMTVLAPEPETEHGRPRTLREAFVGPFLEFFTRHGRPSGALLVLVFIVIYKLGDNLASHMTIPFYLETGFSNTEIGAVVKAFGLASLFVGVFFGGVSTLKLGIYRALLVAGVLQGVSTLGFAALAVVGYDLGWLAAVIAFETFTQGMGLAALLAFMAYLTDTRFTAAQFALLSALTSLPRVLLTAPTGWLASQMGWISFFVFSALVAIPGLLLLLRFRSWFPHESGAERQAVGSAP